MAFLGDFGKFFGLGSSKEVLGDVGSAIGGFVGGPGGAVIGQKIGGTIGSATSSLASSDISPLSTADQSLEQSAVPVSKTGNIPQETSTMTGTTGMTMQAGFGSLVPSLIGGAKSIFPQIGKFISTPTGAIATGVGTSVGVNLLGQTDNGKMKPVLTQSRRNKARVRQLVNFMGIEGSAQFLSQASGQNVTGADVVQLLLRTFRNDGAYITKAQVRNLRRTTNRFKSLEKQVKEATSMSRTRRTPTRRTTTTLIKN